MEGIFSKERVAWLAHNDELIKYNLIEDLLDQHDPDRVLFQNTRLVMSGFPQRIAHLVFRAAY